MPTVQELQTAQMQKIADARAATRQNDPWAPPRPTRPTIWVRPSAQFARVLDGAGGFITGPTEVDANDSFIQRRIKDEELQVLSSDELQRLLNPDPVPQPEAAAPPPAPEVVAAAPPPAQPETISDATPESTVTTARMGTTRTAGGSTPSKGVI